MRKQDFRNHVRYYTPHHFIFYPVIAVLLIYSSGRALSVSGSRPEWIAIILAFALTGWVAFMMRQHYALTLQNRIVRLEMRQRYFELTKERFDGMERRLSFGQIAALRFASDDELPALIRRAIDEGLSPSAIKKAVQNWAPDHMRV